MVSTTNIVILPGNTDHSTALENSRLVRTARGRMLRLKASNLSGSDLYLQVHDRATAIVADAVPVFVATIFARGMNSLGNMNVDNGLVVALSTTPATYTAPLTASGWFHIEHK